MRHCHVTGVTLALLLGGCSLIVSGKLDEKKGDGSVVGGDRSTTPGLTVKGERGKTYQVIAERLLLTSTSSSFKNAKAVRLTSADGTVPCPLPAFDQEVLRCTIPSLTPEGDTKVTVHDGTGAILGEAQTVIRRLVLAGGPDQAIVKVFTAEPFAEEGTLDLKQVLGGATPPLLSPSGRYILAELGPGLTLLDVVTGKLHPLTTDAGPCKGAPFGINASPHSFQPRFSVIAREPEPPVVQHLPEERVWIVDDQKRLRVFELAKVLEGKPSGTVKRDSVKQVYWAVAPETGGAHAAGFILSAIPKQHATLAGDGSERSVGISDAVTQVAHALPAEGATVRRELLFLVHVSSPARMIGVREDGSQAFQPSALLYDATKKELILNSLVPIPGTSLLGFTFDAYPQAIGQLIYGRLVGGGAPSFEVRQEAGALVVVGKETEVGPGRHGELRMLVRSGAQASTFDPARATPVWSQVNAQFTDMVHHPRKEIVFATKPSELLRFSYASKAQPDSITLAPANLKMGAYIQP